LIDGFQRLFKVLGDSTQKNFEILNLKDNCFAIQEIKSDLLTEFLEANHLSLKNNRKSSKNLKMALPISFYIP